MGDALRSMRLTVRGLAHSPGFSLAATLILGLGLGLTGYMFGAVNAYILRPLPFPGADRLVHLEYTRLDGSVEVPLRDFLDWRGAQTSLEHLAAFYTGTVNLSDDARSERFDGAFVTANAFELLGVRPQVGRGFREGDDAPGAPAVVVLGDALWQRHYGGDPTIVGRAVRVNGRPATVVGVMPEGFRFPLNEDVWTTLPLELGGSERGPGLEVFGRLGRGVSLGRARDEFRALAARVAEARPDTERGTDLRLKPYAEEFIDSETRFTLYTMLATVLMVLVIACANVANLVLARNTRRRRELAIRSALGASRRRLVAQVLGECLVLAIAGAALGGALGSFAGDWTLAALRSSETLAPPYWVRFETDWRTTALLGVAAFLSAGLAGVVPALRATKLDVQHGLRAGGHGFAGSPLGRPTRAFLAVQLAFCCVVLVGAALSARGVAALQRVEIGADVSNVLTGRIGLFEADYPTPADRVGYFERLEERLLALPGVQAATTATSLPATFLGRSWVVPEGREVPAGARIPFAARAAVSPGYFEALRIPVLEGRAFRPEDRDGSPAVVIVNRRMAEQHWPGRSALGRRIRLGHPDDDEAWRTIVGVVTDVVQNELDEILDPTVYLPLAQEGPRFASFAVRTSGDPLAMAGSVRRVARDLDPDTPVYWLRTLDAWIERGRFQSRFFAVLFGSFAIAGLLLGALGQYAVLAYAVGQRTRELGLRRALGAADRELVGMTLRDGARHLGLGLGAGLALSVGFTRALASVLYGVQAFDLATLASVAGGLTLAVLLASLVPARRALSVDPAAALRED